MEEPIRSWRSQKTVHSCSFVVPAEETSRPDLADEFWPPTPRGLGTRRRTGGASSSTSGALVPLPKIGPFPRPVGVGSRMSSSR